MSSVERLKYQARVGAGALLHRLGLYRQLLPIVLPRPTEIERRLQSYLNHYYEQTEHAEAVLYLPDLGLKFACDIKDHMLWPYLEGQAQICELADIRHCQAQVRPGDSIVDIGANHGFWGFTLASCQDSGTRLYLCEANPVILNRLRRTVRLNPDIAARILPFAISDGTAAELTFYLPEGVLSGLGSTVLHSFAADKGWLSADRKITVPSRSLDALMDEGVIRGMDVVKIDVEQAEDAVIRGGLRAMQHFRPRLLMVETSQDSWATAALKSMGYQTYQLDEAGREKPVEAGYWGNIFFTWDHVRA